MGILDFNANDARNIIETNDNSELETILINIKKRAEGDKTSLHIYSSLKLKTLSELEKRGFKIYNHPSIAIQKDGLYYTINW